MIMWNTGNLVLIIASPSPTPVGCKEESTDEASRMKNDEQSPVGDSNTGKGCPPPSLQNQNHDRTAVLQTDRKGAVMILEELTRLSSNLCNTLNMISPLAFAPESTQSDPQSVDEDLEVKRSVHALDKIIAMAKQCRKALNSFVYQSDCRKSLDYPARQNQQMQLHIEPSYYLHKDLATCNSLNSMTSGDDHSLIVSFKDPMQVVIHQQYMENVNHDGSVPAEKENRYLSEPEYWYPCVEALEEEWSGNELDYEASLTEESESDEEFKEAELQLEDSLFYIQFTQNADDKASGESESSSREHGSQETDVLNLQHSGQFDQEALLENIEYLDGVQYPPQSLTQLQICKINSSKMEAAAAEELDHEASECEFWSPSEILLQELEKSTALFQNQLSREVKESDISVEETELPYPSDLFGDNLHSDGIISREQQALNWELELSRKPNWCQSLDLLEAVEESTPELGLIPKSTDPWSLQADYGTAIIEGLERWKEFQFHDMACTGLESLTNLGELRASTEESTPELKHDALASLKDLEVDDGVGFFTGLQLSGKVCTQLSLVEEVRKALKEYYTQESLKELEVHDICFTRQKILEADFKPLMEELLEDSFAEYPSPASSSTNENSPPSELSEDHQLIMSNVTENITTHKPLTLSKSVYSCAAPLLPRMNSSDTETLEELVSQHQASLKSAIIGLDSQQQLRIQAPELESKESSPVYTYLEMPDDDDSSDFDVLFTQPQWMSSRLVTDWDLKSLKVPTLDPDSTKSISQLETSAELLGGSLDHSEFVHEPLADLEPASKIEILELSTSKDPQEQYCDVVFSELPNFQQVDLWKPLVEADGVGAHGQTDLEFLFPAHFKQKVSVSSEEDDKKESVLTHSVEVLETPTSYPKAECNSQELVEPSLSFRASKGGLKKIAGVPDFSRSKRTVTFADETQTDTCDEDEEDRCFPSLKSWEIDDEEPRPQLPISSKHHKQQSEAEKPPPKKFHETSVPQSHNHRTTSKTKSTDSSDNSFSSKKKSTGVMQNMFSSFSGRLFSYPRNLLASKAKESRSRIRRSNSWRMPPPKETNFGGSARTDAEQIKAILRASRKTFTGLTTSDILSQELD